MPKPRLYIEVDGKKKAVNSQTFIITMIVRVLVAVAAVLMLASVLPFSFWEIMVVLVAGSLLHSVKVWFIEFK